MATVTYHFSSDGTASVAVEGELADASATVEQIRNEGLFSELKFIAQEFYEAPVDGVRAVKSVMPGAEVISDTAVTPQASVSGALKPTGPVTQSLDPCEKCGLPTTYRKGTKNGGWEALFCESGNRDHTKFL